MVYESPAAGRPVACRKHSPWTMERDRKKSKAHLGSPEPLSEEVEEEEEEEERNDHEMTEQEAQVLACLGELNVRSLLSNQADTDGAALSRAGSVPDGQRRKLRGSRALSASYHNRLRSCMLNDKGSPILHSSRSFTTAAGGGQENVAPILFAPVTFGEHSKCWLGRRHSPGIKDTSSTHSPQQQGTSGVHPANFPVHITVSSTTAADHSLLAAAALANSSRHDKHHSCNSPAPKGRSHRRSLSGASIPATSGLNDSAEALHGPAAEGCAGGQGGPPPLPSGWQHPRGASEGSGPVYRHVAAVKAGGSANSSNDAGPGDARRAGDDDACDHRQSGLPLHGQFSSSAASTSVTAAQPALVASVAKYGIAAFGVPASVQSCFGDALTSADSMQRPAAGSTGGNTAEAGSAAHQHELLARCAMSCPGDMCNAAVASCLLSRPTMAPAQQGASRAIFTGLSSHAASEGGIGPGSGPEPAELGAEPLADTSSEPVIASHMRHGGMPFLGTGLGPGNKALADSAEELELRRLTHHQPHAPAGWHEEVRQGTARALQHLQPAVDLQQQEQVPLRGADAVLSRPASMGSGAAATVTFSTAASGPLPSALLVHIGTTPFDLVSLARSAGSANNNFTSFSTSGHFSIDAVQGAVGDKPPSLNLWPAAPGGSARDLRGSFADTDDEPAHERAAAAAAVGTSSWPSKPCFVNNAVDSDLVIVAVPVDVPAPGGINFDASAAGTETEQQAAQTSQQQLPQQRSSGDQAVLSDRATDDSKSALGGGNVPAQDNVGLGDGGCNGDGDGEDEESWLRTSQQAPDPDDPSSAGKYSAVLLRRLQAAAEHEELYAQSGHSGAYGFYHLQGSCGSGLSQGDCGLRSHGSSSMEPSPLPRMSSRLRRLRVSPCLGGSGAGGSGGSSGGPLTSPAPSHLLGTRSRSAGVTPGGVTCRRLRRRSDLLVPDQVGQGSASARGRADVDEPDDSDGGVGADEHMHDAGHQFLMVGGSGDRLCLLAGRTGERHRNMALQPRHASKGIGLQFATSASLELRSEPMQRMFSHADASGEGLGTRARSTAGQILLPQHRSQPQAGDDFLSGLMDYEDSGVEYMTPPHTPLRGFSGAHEHDAATAPRGALGGFTISGGPSGPSGTSAAVKDTFAIAPSRCPPGISRGLLQQRVTFAAHRLGGADSPHPSSLPTTAVGRGGDGFSCAQLLLSQSLETTQEFNRCLALAATNNDRGSTERLWHEMCSRGVTPDADTLNLMLRCLSRSAADPDEAQLLVREVCRRGAFSVNATTQRLLEEICFRFEQLNGSTHTA